MSSCHYLLFCLLLLPLTSPLAIEKCQQGSNCKMPRCRCWDSHSSPGSLIPWSVPQMVLVSFTSAINSANVDDYIHLFTDVHNPNDCPSLGSVFVQKNYSSPDAIDQLSQDGHEIAMTLQSGMTPDDWDASLMDTKEFLKDSVKASSSQIIGFRAPDLNMGADKQMTAMERTGLIYDSSCVSMNASNLLWPYTYDYVLDTPLCTNGHPPSQSHPGVWQFIRPVMLFNKTTLCSTPAACSKYFDSSEDVFSFLKDNFLRHYNGLRTPFQLEINPQWLVESHLVVGTMKFLLYLSSGFQDKWIIKYSQALDWIRNPVDVDKAKTFAPWGC